MLSVLKKITTWTLSSIGWNGRTPGDALQQINDVTRIIMEWPEGELFTAEKALCRFPHLQNSRESLINLVVHEFAERRVNGDFVDLDEFLEAFPEDLRSDLCDAISVDRGLTVLSGLVTGLHNGTRSSLSRLTRKLDWPESGEVFAGFLLEEPLGRGGFSRVFAAREIAFENRRVAVKVCRNDTHEPSVLANLQHSGIGTIHSVTEVPERGLIAICMPLLSRTTLLDVRSHVWSRTRRPSTALPVWECIRRGNNLNRATPLWAEARYCEWVLDVTISLCRALSVSHEKGIVHCDIKPSNILLSEDGRPILFDFNIAFRELATNSPANIGGTIPYMAPEQIVAFSGSGATEVGPGTDLFALGATIYELLTGTAPYGGIQTSQGGIEKLLALRQVPPVRIRQLNSSVPSDIAELIQQCLSYSPQERFGSAAELVDQLERMKKKIYGRISPRRRLVATLTGTVAAVAAAAAFFASQSPEKWHLNSNATIVSGAVVGTEALEPERISLTTEQITELMHKGYKQLDNGDPDSAVDAFSKVLMSNPHHSGAAIGAIRAAIRMPGIPENPDVRRISQIFNPCSIPELEALCGTADSGILTGDFSRAEIRLRRAMTAGRNDVATRNNLAYCLLAQSRHNEARSVLEEILADGDAPDVSRLLLARARMNILYQHVTRTTPDSVSLEARIAEQRFENLIEPCKRSALRSITEALVAHTCCVGYGQLASSGMPDGQNEEWLRYSRRVVEAYAEAVEQGISPYTWRLLYDSLHIGVTDTARVRDLHVRFQRSGPDVLTMNEYRRAYLLDPVEGTPYERWKAPTTVPASKVSKTQIEPENLQPEAAAIARVQ